MNLFDEITVITAQYRALHQLPPLRYPCEAPNCDSLVAKKDGLCPRCASVLDNRIMDLEERGVS